LRAQPYFAYGHESEQPGALVGVRMGGHDLRTVDIEALEDLPDRFLPEPVRYGGRLRGVSDDRSLLPLTRAVRLL